MSIAKEMWNKTRETKWAAKQQQKKKVHKITHNNKNNNNNTKNENLLKWDKQKPYR